MMPIGRQVASGLSLPPAARRCSASAADSGRSGSGSFMFCPTFANPARGTELSGSACAALPPSVPKPCQTPVRSGLPSAVRGAGASRSGAPSAVRGIRLLGWGSH